MHEQGKAGEPQSSVADGPARSYESEASGTYLAFVLELARLLDIEVSPTSHDTRAARDVWGTVRGPLAARPNLSDDFFTPLVAAAIYEPDPSFTGWFVKPALGAFGRLRVRRALLEYLKTGSDQERMGAAQAWYYTQLRRSEVRASEGKAGAESDSPSDLTAEWREAALHEFVENDNLTLRHYLLRSLPLNTPEAFSFELRNLVSVALEIANRMPR